MKIEEWLQEQIAEETGMNKENISCDESFENLDMDSLAQVSLAYALENRLNKEISPTVFSEYNTINKLSEWVINQN